MIRTGRMRGSALFFWGILSPALAVMVCLTVYPMANVLANSFQNYNYITDSRSWAGLGNFREILGDELFRNSFTNTIIYCLVTTVIEVALGIILALVFYGDFPMKRTFMIITIFPMMVSTMVVCAVWKTLYHYDIGLLNYLVKSVGGKPVGWLIDPKLALMSLIIVDVWQWTPFSFIVMQAGLSSIPMELFEAAMIDGASYRQTVFRITLPILLEQILLLALLRTIDTFKVFAKVFALTRGGPGNATETTSLFIYREGFSYFNIGRASAASIITLTAVIVVSVFYLRKILKDS